MLILAIALSVLLLIIVLQNVAFPMPLQFIVWQLNSTVVLLFASIFGVASGFCYALAFNSIIETKREEEAEETGGKF